MVEPSHGVMNAKTTSERPKGYTALHFLAQAKSQHDDGDERVKIATRLLDLGADPDSLDFRLNPPIFLAAGASFLKMAKLLHKDLHKWWGGGQRYRNTGPEFTPGASSSSRQ